MLFCSLLTILAMCWLGLKKTTQVSAAKMNEACFLNSTNNFVLDPSSCKIQLTDCSESYKTSRMSEEVRINE